MHLEATNFLYLNRYKTAECMKRGTFKGFENTWQDAQ